VNATAGRIGPNAILQAMAALTAELGMGAGQALMRRAGLGRHVDAPPAQMVDERDVQALHRALRAELGITRARALGREAGLRTGDYLLAHRIPPIARAILPWLPARWASRILLAAVARHAWTFCGSGIFSIHPPTGSTPLRVSLTGCATCVATRAEEPLCDYFAATFERLFQVLVHPNTRVRELACQAMGAPACVFEIRW
jgi:divinyl protochlorophyllide a 8-vinyl-reductase